MTRYPLRPDTPAAPEWFDPQPQTIKTFILTYHTHSNEVRNYYLSFRSSLLTFLFCCPSLCSLTVAIDYHHSQIEMKDKTNNRKFLKKTRLPSKLSQEDFTIGACIVLLSRNLKIGNFN